MRIEPTAIQNFTEKSNLAIDFWSANTEELQISGSDKKSTETQVSLVCVNSSKTEKAVSKMQYYSFFNLNTI